MLKVKMFNTYDIVDDRFVPSISEEMQDEIINKYYAMYSDDEDGKTIIDFLKSAKENPSDSSAILVYEILYNLYLGNITINQIEQYMKVNNANLSFSTLYGFCSIFGDTSALRRFYYKTVFVGAAILVAPIAAIYEIIDSKDTLKEYLQRIYLSKNVDIPSIIAVGLSPIIALPAAIGAIGYFGYKEVKNIELHEILQVSDSKPRNLDTVNKDPYSSSDIRIRAKGITDRDFFKKYNIAFNGWSVDASTKIIESKNKRWKIKTPLFFSVLSSILGNPIKKDILSANRSLPAEMLVKLDSEKLRNDFIFYDTRETLEWLVNCCIEPITYPRLTSEQITAGAGWAFDGLIGSFIEQDSDTTLIESLIKASPVILKYGQELAKSEFAKLYNNAIVYPNKILKDKYKISGIGSLSDEQLSELKNIIKEEIAIPKIVKNFESNDPFDIIYGQTIVRYSKQLADTTIYDITDFDSLLKPLYLVCLYKLMIDIKIIEEKYIKNPADIKKDEKDFSNNINEFYNNANKIWTLWNEILADGIITRRCLMDIYGTYLEYMKFKSDTDGNFITDENGNRIETGYINSEASIVWKNKSSENYDKKH